MQGVKIKMDDAGNILIRRYSKTNVYIKSTSANPNDESAIGAEILKLPNNGLESEKIVKVSGDRRLSCFGIHTLTQIQHKHTHTRPAPSAQHGNILLHVASNVS